MYLVVAVPPKLFIVTLFIADSFVKMVIAKEHLVSLADCISAGIALSAWDCSLPSEEQTNLA